MLKGKKILLGVTGGIAAYKIAFLVRLLVKSGAIVKVIMTASAKDFITPLTLSVLSKNPVLSESSNKQTGEWNNHVELGLWADIMVIAPASANTLSKMASGTCDNLLLTAYMSAKCPVFFAPAMDLDMYKHSATISNIDSLCSSGNIIIPAEKGELASGLEGEGRMAEPETILYAIDKHFSNAGSLKGKKALVTAGPTYEAIDPVRFIGNFSSGKMGFAIAEELAARGAQVELVAGPVALKTLHPKIKRTNVVNAIEMSTVCKKLYKKADITIMSAAVADYAPEKVENLKIKKKKEGSTLMLKPTPDILYYMGLNKKKNQLLIGFALETHDEIKNAKQKLTAKNLDFIVLNSLNEKGAGFRFDTNKITIIDKNNKTTVFELKTKREAAADIVDYLSRLVS